MLGATRLDADLELDLADLQARAVAGVQHLDDVGVGLGDEPRDLRELAGPVGQADPQTEVAVRPRPARG